MSDSLSQRALTDSDAAAFAGLSNAIADAGHNDRREDEATFRFYLHHPMASPEFEDFQGVFDGDRLVAMAWVVRRAEAEPAHWMISNGGVHPDYQGRGIGTRLVRWQLDCARRVHEHYFPGRPLELGTRIAERNTAAQELFAHEGYERERWFFSMRRPAEAPLPEVSIPAGLELEPYTDAVREELHRALEEAFRDHWRHVPASAEDFAALIGQRHMRHDLSFLLRDPANGEIAGFLIAGFNESEFEATGVRDVHFHIIGTREAYRGRGIASALIGHAVVESRELGFEGATLGVDAENPSGALGVYERNGFACENRVAVYIRKFD
jgi:mycothiol synthase